MGSSNQCFPRKSLPLSWKTSWIGGCLSEELRQSANQSSRHSENERRNVRDGFPLFSDKIPSQSLWSVFERYGVIRLQTEQKEAPWWMQEYYQLRTGESVRTPARLWKPSFAGGA